MGVSFREVRKAPRKKGEENTSLRNEFQRDRDRIVHCSAFRRLGSITQVVSPNQSGTVHNRLTHTLKVAQIGRRLAERLLELNKGTTYVEDLGGIDPDVVDAAGLAHDLGHPPFGHVAEYALQEAANKILQGDSFEGNAQTFRIINSLAVRTKDWPGLDLTCATCNAILKYPWTKAQKKKKTKWGVYQSEKEVFEWARTTFQSGLKFELADRKTLEAELMDFADDIAYSVYDLEDFAKSGKIPLAELLEDTGEGDDEITGEAKLFLDRYRSKVCDEEGSLEANNRLKSITEGFKAIRSSRPSFPNRYTGTREERARFRDWTSSLVGLFMKGCSLPTLEEVQKDTSMSLLTVDPLIRKQVDCLKAITYMYVVHDPSLANQQRGYRKIVMELYRSFAESASKGDLNGLPPWMTEELNLPTCNDRHRHRLIMDFIASLTETDAVNLYLRISGVSSGAMFGSGF